MENSYRYDAFGNLLERKETVPNRILYTGQQYDQETGQYYLRARYYNPVVGRFLQEDTYHGDGLNLYAYCGNNPVVYYDPGGHDSAAVMKKAEEPDLPVGVGKGGTKIINEADKIKISSWKYTPSDELYLKYKDVYDNPLYYDQITGEIHWPKGDGFKIGSKNEKEIPQGTIFKRYGENSGEFLGNTTDSFESRALAPHSDDAKVHYYQLVVSSNL